jgi:hypothetical protein
MADIVIASVFLTEAVSVNISGMLLFLIVFTNRRHQTPSPPSPPVIPEIGI